MPKLDGGHHPYCAACGGANAEPKWKWCPGCRAAEQAASPTDALADGLRCRPGRSGPGWFELI